MNWYYALNGQQQGPASEQDMEQLAASGTINASTLVWSEGLADWQPLSQALPGALSVAPVNAPQIGGFAVPAAQKDLYVQQMREGVAPTLAGSVEYGGFWLRVVAKIVDFLILAVPNYILQFSLGLGMTGFGNVSNPAEPDPAKIALLLGVMAFSLSLNVFYQTFMVSKYAATLGKMAVGLKVVNEDGSKVSTGRAFGRFFAELLSAMTCYIGYIIAAFDSEKRALHDHVCSTRVIKVR